MSNSVKLAMLLIVSSDLPVWSLSEFDCDQVKTAINEASLEQTQPRIEHLCNAVRKDKQSMTVFTACLLDQARIAHNNARFPVAIYLYKKCLDLHQAIYKTRINDACAQDLYELSQVYLYERSLNESLSAIQECYSIKSRVHGRKSKQLIPILHSLFEVSFQQFTSSELSSDSIQDKRQKLLPALSYIDEADRIANSTRFIDKDKVLLTQDRFAVANWLDDNEARIALQKKLLDQNTVIFGPYAVETLDARSFLSAFYLDRKNFAEAQRYMEECIAIHKLHNLNDTLAGVLSKVAKLLMLQNKLAEAATTQKEAVAALDKYFYPNDPQMNEEVVAQLYEIFTKLGDRKTADKLIVDSHNLKHLQVEAHD